MKEIHDGCVGSHVQIISHLLTYGIQYRIWSLTTFFLSVKPAKYKGKRKLVMSVGEFTVDSL